MIVLNLSCGNSHGFEGWFASIEEFQRQAEARQVTCPHCNNASITIIAVRFACQANRA